MQMKTEFNLLNRTKCTLSEIWVFFSFDSCLVLMRVDTKHRYWSIYKMLADNSCCDDDDDGDDDVQKLIWKIQVTAIGQILVVACTDNMMSRCYCSWSCCWRWMTAASGSSWCDRLFIIYLISNMLCKHSEEENC